MAPWIGCGMALPIPPGLTLPLGRSGSAPAGTAGDAGQATDLGGTVMAILTPEMKRVVREQRLGYVATVCPDHTPNVSPKGTTTVWDDDHLIFADICSPRTVENLRHNPAIEINVVDPILRKGYRFRGSAIVLQRGAQFEEAMEFYRDIYGMHPKTADSVRHVVLVKVERALPLISPIYDLGATEDEVVARYTKYYGGLRPNKASGVASSARPRQERDEKDGAADCEPASREAAYGNEKARP